MERFGVLKFDGPFRFLVSVEILISTCLIYDFQITRSLLNPGKNNFFKSNGQYHFLQLPNYLLWPDISWKSVYLLLPICLFSYMNGTQESTLFKFIIIAQFNLQLMLVLVNSSHDSSDIHVRNVLDNDIELSWKSRTNPLCGRTKYRSNHAKYQSSPWGCKAFLAPRYLSYDLGS